MIVVDDGSTDGTAAAAAAEGVRVVRLGQQSGPAVARNRGALAATGRYLLFVDADVCVLADTLGEIVGSFEADPGVDCVFGSYDLEPRAENLVSQYRNLLHHFVHQGASPEATTFWAGCGAVRRDVFQRLGGFSTRYRRPQIEDIELGVRYVKAGCRIRLNRNAQATHLKRWSLWGMIKTDVRDRGIPWTRLILESGSLPNDMNLSYSQRVSTLLALGVLILLFWGALQQPWILGLAVLGTLLLGWLDRWSFNHKVPLPVWGLLPAAGVGAVVSCGYFYSPAWAGLVLGGLAGIVALNYRLYSFFARKRHSLFAMHVLPLHVCYFLYSGFSFGVGVALHLANVLGGSRRGSLTEVPALMQESQPATEPAGVGG